MNEDIVSFGMDRSFKRRIVLFEKSHYLHMTFAITFYLIFYRKKILLYFFHIKEEIQIFSRYITNSYTLLFKNNRNVNNSIAAVTLWNHK